MASLDLESLARQAAEQVGIILTDKLKNSLKATMKQELKVSLQAGIRAFERKLFEQFDILLNSGQAGSEIIGLDDTSLINIRGAFEQSVTKDLSLVKFDGDTITITVGNSEEWGLDRPGKLDRPLQVLGIWIEGNVGPHGFISKEHYALRRTKARDLGHFGTGFMISEERYKVEKWEKITGIPFAQVKHPISGQPPFDGFKVAAEAFDWSPYVCEAIQNSFTKLLV